jgi:hypothetical protein
MVESEKDAWIAQGMTRGPIKYWHADIKTRGRVKERHAGYCGHTMWTNKNTTHGPMKKWHVTQCNTTRVPLENWHVEQQGPDTWSSKNLKRARTRDGNVMQ